MLEIPCKTKISYFFKRNFLNAILKLLLVVDGLETKYDTVENLTNEICTLRKSPLEQFLDIISIEFNKHDRAREKYNDDPEREQTAYSIKHTQAEDLGEQFDLEYIFPVGIINQFLSLIDVEIVSSWYDGTTDQHEDEENKIENFRIRVSSSNVDTNCEKIKGRVYRSKEEGLEIDRTRGTQREKKILTYEKKYPNRKRFLIESKVSSELCDLDMTDLKDLIDQLYLYMSIIFCVGILGKRAAWGLTQARFLNNSTKVILKKWCDIEINSNEELLDLDFKIDIENEGDGNLNFPSSLDYKDTAKPGLENESSKLPNEDINLRNELNDLKAKNEELNMVNKQLFNEKEKLCIKNQSLIEVIKTISKPSKEHHSGSKGSCKQKSGVNKVELSKKRGEEVDRLEKHSKELKDNRDGMIERLERKKTEEITMLKEKEESMLAKYVNKVQHIDNLLGALENEYKTKLEGQMLEYERIFSEINDLFILIKANYCSSRAVIGKELSEYCAEFDDLVNKLSKLQREAGGKKGKSKDCGYREISMKIYPDNEMVLYEDGAVVGFEGVRAVKNVTTKIDIYILFDLLNQNLKDKGLEKIYQREIIYRLKKYRVLKDMSKRMREKNIIYLAALKSVIRVNKNMWSWITLKGSEVGPTEAMSKERVGDFESQRDGREFCRTTRYGMEDEERELLFK